jgi:hypothetical protein
MVTLCSLAHNPRTNTRMPNAQNSLNILLKLFEASPLASTEALLESTEETKVAWCYILGIRRIRHSCELFY